MRVVRLIWRSSPPPRELLPANYTGLDERIKLEEATMPTWGRYYPARLGEVLQCKHQVLSKLGYGANSTVWFGRDMKEVLIHLKHNSYFVAPLCGRQSLPPICEKVRG